MSRAISLVNIILYFFFQFVITSLFIGVYFILGGTSLAVMLWLQVFTNFLLMGVLYLLNRRYLKEQFSKFSKKMIIISLITYVAYIAISSFVTVIITLLGLEAVESENQLYLIELLQNVSIPAVVTMTMIQAPFMEEIVFRSSIIHLFTGKDGYNTKNKMLYYIGMAASLLFFVSIHITTEIFAGTPALDILLTSYPYILLTGALLFVYNHFKGNVAASMTLHCIVNSISSIILVLAIMFGSL